MYKPIIETSLYVPPCLGDLESFAVGQNIAVFPTNTRTLFLGKEEKSLIGNGAKVGELMRKFSDCLFKHHCCPDEIVYRNRHVNVVLGDAMRTMVPLGMAGQSKKYI